MKKKHYKIGRQTILTTKKDYVPFEESNVKFYKNGINTKVPPDIFK